MSASVGDWCWHVHHGDGLLLERLIEPYETRQKYIRENKPSQEVETRLRLFQPVRGKVTPPLYWQEVDAKWQEADAKRQEALAKWRASPSWKAVEALHATECPGCPWNGETIFPLADKEGT